MVIRNQNVAICDQFNGRETRRAEKKQFEKRQISSKEKSRADE